VDTVFAHIQNAKHILLPNQRHQLWQNAETFGLTHCARLLMYDSRETRLADKSNPRKDEKWIESSFLWTLSMKRDEMHLSFVGTGEAPHTVKVISSCPVAIQFGSNCRKNVRKAAVD
jgi:hypothetical protein